MEDLNLIGICLDAQLHSKRTVEGGSTGAEFVLFTYPGQADYSLMVSNSGQLGVNVPSS